MNEYERRTLDLAQNHMNLMAAAGIGGARGTLEPYVYTVRLGSVAVPLVAGTLIQGLLPLQADSYFHMSYMAAAVVLSADPSTALTPSGELQLTDTGNGQTLYSQANPCGVLVGGCDNNGAAGLPFLLTVPRILLPNTNIKIDYTHRGANADALFIAFFGTRVYTS